MANVLSGIRERPMVLIPLGLLAAAMGGMVFVPDYGFYAMAFSLICALAGLASAIILLHGKRKSELYHQRLSRRPALHLKSKPEKPGSLDDHLIDLDDEIGST